MWEAVAGLRFRKANVTEPAHILIGAQLDPKGWAFADVFYDAVSSKPIKPISQALICLNPSRRWKVGFDGNFKVYDLRYTFLHEIGHAIGLDHPIVPDQIMSIRYEERFRELQPGDAVGANILYGAPFTRTVAYRKPVFRTTPFQSSAATEARSRARPIAFSEAFSDARRPSSMSEHANQCIA